VIRPGGLVAAGCFALLSLFRAQDGAAGWAALFAVLALVNLALAFRGPSPTSPETLRGQPAADRVGPEVRHARVKGWLGIAVAGWAFAVTGVFVFPPMSIVLAGMALYATLRYLRDRRGLLRSSG
jgi:hypothetical protein